MVSSEYEAVRPGMYPSLHTLHFTPEEKQIVTNISSQWYVTHGGDSLKLTRTSIYRYFLVKPTDIFREMFNLSREILVLFSPYSEFEPRTLDAIELASRAYQPLRLERIVTILISNDKDIEVKIKRILATERETQIVVPFTYDELLTNNDLDLMPNRFREHFYNRDLFAYEAPLTKDLYFYGRTNLIQDIVNRYKSNENSALFGLRKTGKTSVINAVTRFLIKENVASVIVDCQDPSFHQRRWNEALYFVVNKIVTENRLKVALEPETKYTQKEASSLFQSEMRKIASIAGRVLIVFDEIENITFGIAAGEHWKNDRDFIYFWQSIRATFQRDTTLLNFLIVGTNPRCIEEAKFKDIDNPILHIAPFQYIPGFTYEQTKEMVSQLGSIMGLIFEDPICSKLTEDYGGHPFLIRHVCSVIHKEMRKKRPVQVGRYFYEAGRDRFNLEYGRFIDMILEVLRKFYTDEYEMLKYLALGDKKTFHELARMSQTYTSHLLGYGIVDRQDDEYFLKVECIKDHIKRTANLKPLVQTQEQMLAEISSRRNALEPRLRFLIRTQLQARYGTQKAWDLTMDVLDNKRQSKLKSLSYNDLFNPSTSTIFFRHLSQLVLTNWACFQNIFRLSKEDFKYRMDTINKYRSDAHAKKLNEKEMSVVRVCFDDVVDAIKEYTEFG